jgi:hypothetical protein
MSTPKRLHDASFYSIGIDPGRKGGICILSPDRKIVRSSPMPETEVGIWFWLKDAIRLQGEDLSKCSKLKACIEKVGGYIGSNEERGGDRGSHMFVFGRTYGALTMSLVALDLYPYLEVAPRTWQGYYSLSREEEESDKDWKNRLKDKAKELYPEDHITLNTCDAILLSHYLSMR